MSISTTVLREFGGDAPRRDTQYTKLIDFFPSEIVAFYTALLGLPFLSPEEGGMGRVRPEHMVYAISLVMTVVLVVYFVQRKYRAEVPDWTVRGLVGNGFAKGWKPALTAMIAFTLWAFALPGSHLQEPVLSRFIAQDQYQAAATVISGAIAGIFVMLWRPPVTR